MTNDLSMQALNLGYKWSRPPQNFTSLSTLLTAVPTTLFRNVLAQYLQNTTETVTNNTCLHISE
jgi:hypothetical protein